MPEKLSLIDVQNFLLDKNENVVLLSTEYVNQYEPLTFQCSCGEIFTQNWITCHRRTYTVCPKCALIKRGQNRKNKYYKVKSIFEQHNLILLEKEYKSNTTPMLCKDAQGYMGLQTLASVQKGSHFEIFVEPFFIYNLNVWTQNNGINTKVIGLAKVDKWTRKGIACQCQCGNIFETSFTAFLSGKFRCDQCTNRISTYEAMIINWFNLHNINYISQYRIAECKNILTLPFDFYLPKYDVLIEIDGEGHFGLSYFNHCSEEKALKRSPRRRRCTTICGSPAPGCG